MGLLPKISICFLLRNYTHNSKETSPQPSSPVTQQSLFKTYKKFFLNPQVFIFFSIKYFASHPRLPVVPQFPYPAATRLLAPISRGITPIFHVCHKFSSSQVTFLCLVGTPFRICALFLGIYGRVIYLFLLLPLFVLYYWV